MPQSICTYVCAYVYFCPSAMSPARGVAEHEVLQDSLWPVRILLVKVHIVIRILWEAYCVHHIQKLAFKTINLTTLLLLAWACCPEDMELDLKLVPHDVATYWNSTYNMLSFVLEHQKAIENYTDDWQNNLQKFELTLEEWRVVKQLCDILEVSSFQRLLSNYSQFWYWKGGCKIILFLCNA